MTNERLVSPPLLVNDVIALGVMLGGILLLSWKMYKSLPAPDDPCSV